MKLIVITAEQLIPGEALAIDKLFGVGMETLHLRKPFATERELYAMLERIDPAFYRRIVLHDHFCLTESFPLKGVHLNRRNPVAPICPGLSVSRSCHSLHEAGQSAGLDYVFLSPVFNSLSKAGYVSAFTDAQLTNACSQGIINSNVYALGGITPETIPLAARYGFGGVAVLGSLWQHYATCRADSLLLTQYKLLEEALLHVHV